MLNWKKHGRIFNPKESSRHDWMQVQAQNPFALKFENFVRVYFNTRPEKSKDGKNTSYAGFVDLDRNDLSKIIRVSPKPILELGGKGTFDEFGVMAGSVAKIQDKYYLYYVGWSRMLSVPYNWAIGLAVSSDAENFERLGNGPVIGASIKEPYLQAGCSSIMKIEDNWHLWYTSGVKWIDEGEKPESVYQITHAVSKDGIIWNRDGYFSIDPVLENEAQASPTIIKIDDKWHMFFSYRHTTNFRNKERGYRIGYAYSYDLKKWVRNDDMVGIDVSEAGWDSEMICYPHIFELDSKIYMLYCGNDFGKEGFGYAELEI